MVKDIENILESDNELLKHKAIVKSFLILKSNIEDDIIQNERFSVYTSDEYGDDFARIVISKDEYDVLLDQIMKEFIKIEWYEECQEIKLLQHKLKLLYDDENSIADTKTTTTKL